MSQEERLFGAPDRQMALIHLSVQMRPAGTSSVTLEAQSVMRKRWYRLHVELDTDQTPGPVIGLCAPLLHQYYVTPARWAQNLGRLAQRLGQDGYELSIS